MTESLRCADVSLAMATDPVGSAVTADVFVLVETPLPWPADVIDDPVLDAVAAAVRSATSASVRVQAIVGDRPVGIERRVVVWRTSGPWFTQYRRAEAIGAADELARLAAALVTAPSAVHQGAPELLVCTHGTRDRCCGADGTRLWRDAIGTNGGRVWRTSHTGGHRFAPTVLSFPDGLCWGRLDPGTLAAIRSRTAAPAALAAHYRGCVAVGSSAMQAAERAAFTIVGWAWLTWSRRVEQVGEEEVVVHFRTPAGDTGGYRAVVREARRIPVPVCGAPLSAARKDEPEWRVVEVDLVR